MTVIKPRTYMGHPNQGRIRDFFSELFKSPDPHEIERQSVKFLADNPVPITDFPPFEPLYSRTILQRAANHYEAMAARWSKDAVSVIHGHPMFAFYYLVSGRLSVENYEKKDGGIVLLNTKEYEPGQHFCMSGTADTFDNGIHRVTALNESLSIHIYSDDAMKGQVFEI